MNAFDPLTQLLEGRKARQIPFDVPDGRKFRALITGASGVIGISVFRHLIAMNIFQDGRLEIDCICKTSNSEFNRVFRRSGVSVLQLDLASRSHVGLNESYDLIFNCAGYGQPTKFLLDHAAVFSINTALVYDLLNRLVPRGFFLNIGTSEVYSTESLDSTREDSPLVIRPGNSRNAYILAKLAAEEILEKHAEANLDDRVLSARVALAYGPGTRSDDSRVMYQFFQRARDHKVIKLLDDGSSSRRYIFVDDCVEIMLRALFDRERKFRVMNVAGNSDITILELAKKIGALYEAEVIPGSFNMGMKDAPREVKLNTDLAEGYFQGDFMPIEDGLIAVKRWLDFKK